MFEVFTATRLGSGIHRVCDDRDCAVRMTSIALANQATTITFSTLEQERVPFTARRDQQTCCDVCGYPLNYVWLKEHTNAHA